MAPFAILGIGSDTSLWFSDLRSRHCVSDDLTAALDQLQSESAHYPVTFALSYDATAARFLGGAEALPSGRASALDACVWGRVETLSKADVLARLPQDDAPIDWSLDQDYDYWQAAFDRVQAYLRAGDCYQVNLTVRGQGGFSGTSAALHRRLLSHQWVPFHALMPWGEGWAVSQSPELLWSVEHDRIACEPMKGTVANDRLADKADALAAWLAKDPKNRAENVMIVDLIRNDLGRIAVTGSVEVPVAFEVRRYQTVQQMVSRVAATLDDPALASWVNALVPFGSITGAPKKRAIEVIQELEPGPRGVYTGSLGYLYKGKSLANVAIRTLDHEQGRFTFGVGGGITVGSDVAEEWDEVQLKTRFLNA